MMPAQMNLCQVLSWIAFRDESLVTSDPHKLRRDMRRYRKRLVEPNPTGDFLKMVQSGKLTAQGRSANGTELIGPHYKIKSDAMRLWLRPVNTIVRSAVVFPFTSA
jgi:hypothetical protein